MNKVPDDLSLTRTRLQPSRDSSAGSEDETRVLDGSAADRPAPGGTERSVWINGTVLLDDYLIEQQLGAGGMGAVHLARSRATRQAFAVKRLLPHLLRDGKHRRLFLRELLTWSELPDHPHLVPFRFFRAWDDEFLIFSEYVDGGSLKEWIGRGQIRRISQALDIAVQMAWGLHAAHEAGMVHQDVKPSNVLLTQDGTAKLTDFGLARAKEQALAGGPPPEGPAGGVTCSGMTVAYCSPEQAAWKPLTRSSDIWSWGLCLFQMLIGNRSWGTGLAAPEALKRLRQRRRRSGALIIPPEVARVIDLCFQWFEHQRWPDLQQPAEALIDAYQRITGTPYPRPQPPAVTGGQDSPQALPRRTLSGGKWRAPREWLEQALRESGQDPAAAAGLLPPPARTRRGLLLADLIVQEETVRLLEPLAARGLPAPRMALANVLREKAFVHCSLGDISGSIALHGRCADLMEAPAAEGAVEALHLLAGAHLSQAGDLQSTGRSAEALPLHDKAIALRERLTAGSHDPELVERLVSAYICKANLLRNMGQLALSLPVYDQAAAACEQMMSRASETGIVRPLAIVCLNKGNALAYQKDFQGAASLYQRVISLSDSPGWPDNAAAAHMLAMACMNRANALGELEEHGEVIPLLSRAIETWRGLSQASGEWEDQQALATALHNLGLELASVGRDADALGVFDEAAAQFEDLVCRRGLDRLRGDWAYVKLSRAHATGKLEGSAAVIEQARTALAELEDEIARTNRADLRWALDCAREKLAEIGIG